MCLKPDATSNSIDSESDCNSKSNRTRDGVGTVIDDTSNGEGDVKVQVKVRVLCNSTMLDGLHDVESEGVYPSSMIHNNSDDDDDSTSLSKSDVVDDVWKNVSYFIQYWNLSEQEGLTLLQLRDRISDVNHYYNRPGTVIRFMFCKSFDLEDSERMIRESVAWRAEHSVDRILQDYNPPQEILNHYPGAILKGTDREGDPIFVSRTGVTDLYGLVDKYGEEEMIRYEIYRREAAFEGAWIREWETNAGRPIRRIMVIEDLRGLNMRHMSKKATKFFGLVCDLDAKFYPETNKNIIIIRAPAVFRIIWAVVKHFFPSRVVNKMEFCGENYYDVLENHVDLTLLPPCIYPEGKGEAVMGSPPCFEGGIVK